MRSQQLSFGLANDSEVPAGTWNHCSLSDVAVDRSDQFESGGVRPNSAVPADVALAALGTTQLNARRCTDEQAVFHNRSLVRSSPYHWPGLQRLLCNGETRGTDPQDIYGVGSLA